MYMVISKPKRMSLAAGVCHFMVYLLKGAADYGESCTEPFRTQVCTLPHVLVFTYRQDMESDLVNFMRPA